MDTKKPNLIQTSVTQSLVDPKIGFGPHFKCTICGHTLFTRVGLHYHFKTRHPQHDPLKYYHTTSAPCSPRIKPLKRIRKRKALGKYQSKIPVTAYTAQSTHGDLPIITPETQFIMVPVLLRVPISIGQIQFGNITTGETKKI